MSEKNTKSFDGTTARDITKEKNISAKVNFWNAERGFGFLRLETGERVFCHIKSLCFHLSPEDRKGLDQGTSVVVRSLRKEEQGFAANRVECLDCAAPEVWELRPTGKVFFGVEELAPKCTNKEYGQHERDFFSFEDVWSANENFRKAEARWNRFQRSLNESFFQEFGEPLSIKVDEKGSFILSYGSELGEKKVSLYDAFYCGHFPVSSTGEKITKGNSIFVKFCFDTIPNTFFSAHIVSFRGDNGVSGFHPYFTKSFDLLSGTEQKEILEEVKVNLQTPEQIAQERFFAFLNQGRSPRCVSFSDLRKKLVDLQRSGEMSFGSYVENVYESWPESEDGFREAGGGWFQKTRHCLRVGLRKDRFGRLVDGVAIDIDHPPLHKTESDVRDDLVVKINEKIDVFFSDIKDIPTIQEDSRLYDITPEEWKKKYDDVCDTFEKQIRQEWKVIDDQEVEKNKREYEEKIYTLKKEIDLSKELDQHYHDARLFGIPRDLFYTDFVLKNEIDIESLAFNIQILEDAIKKVDECIQKFLKENGLLRLSPEEFELRMKERPSPAPWYVFPKYQEQTITTSVEENFGRKRGEGFGPKVAGKRKYLPGDRALVAIDLSSNSRRESYSGLTVKGVIPFYNETYPEFIGSKFELRALVDDPQWFVSWVYCWNTVPQKYCLANARGITELTLADEYGNGSQIDSKDWEGNDGAGPTMQEVIRAHNLNNTRQKDVAPLLREAKQQAEAPKEKSPAFVPDPNYEAPQNLADFVARINAEQRGMERTQVEAPKQKPVPRHEQPVIDLEQMRRKCEDTLLSIEILILGLANFKKEIANLLSDKIKILRAEYLELLSEFQKPEVNVVSLQGKISTLRNSFQALYKTNGARAIESYDADWIKKYEELKILTIAFINKDAEIAEYISEGIFSQETLFAEIQKVFATKLMNLQKGKICTAEEIAAEVLQKCL